MTKRSQSRTQNRYLYTSVYSLIIHNNQKEETTQVVDRVNKMYYIHTMEY